MLAAVACSAPAVYAQSGKSAVSTSAAIALYTGPDRLQRLIEGAKKEGEVSVYNSAPVDDMKVFAAAFEKKYGVKVNYVRGDSVELAVRLMNEGKAGRVVADVPESPTRVSALRLPHADAQDVVLWGITYRLLDRLQHAARE